MNAVANIIPQGHDRRRYSCVSTAATWFSTEAEFRQLCGDAQSQARGESAQEFAGEMVKKANERGLDTYLTQKQLDYLCKLADWIPPKAIR